MLCGVNTALVEGKAAANQLNTTDLRAQETLLKLYCHVIMNYPDRQRTLLFYIRRASASTEMQMVVYIPSERANHLVASDLSKAERAL